MEALKAGLSRATVGKPSIVELKPYLQPFPYGREGMASMAARFAKEVSPEITIKDDQPYGEIWIGSTHKNGPSEILSSSLITNGTKLRDLINQDPTYFLGRDLLSDQDMQSMYKNDLPFLFKILSFDKALPLQAHPDPKLGARLKKRELLSRWYNSDFVDTNGKPEVSVALTDFSAFIGFRPPRQIAQFLQQVPEFAAIFTKDQIDAVRRASEEADEKPSRVVNEALKSIFGTLMHLPEDKVKQVVLSITDKINTAGAKGAFGDTKDAEALAKIWKKNLTTYGNSDIGIVVTAYLMNLLQLKPGEGCWILADDIHAYVEGDVIECMANSDNMVCHGLGETEQGGRQTFVDMLSYRHLPGEKLLLDYQDEWERGVHGNTRLYKVPIEEFDILRTELTVEKAKESMTLPGPHTFIVTKGTIKAKAGGEELILKAGHTAFVRANVTLDLEVVGIENAELWGAFFKKKDWYYPGAQ